MATVLSPPEQRIVLDNIRWETYESILEAYMDRSVPHFTYDRGRLEIMSPSAEHEDLNRAAARLVEVIAEELDLVGITQLTKFGIKTAYESTKM